MLEHQARREIIRNEYFAGTPVKLIAQMCGSTPGSVKVIAHKMGIRHASRASEISRFQIWRRQHEGVSRTRAENA